MFIILKQETIFLELPKGVCLILGVGCLSKMVNRIAVVSRLSRDDATEDEKKYK